MASAGGTNGMGNRIRNFFGGNANGSNGNNGGGDAGGARPANGRRASDDPNYVVPPNTDEEEFNIWDVKKPEDNGGGNGNGNGGGGNNSGSNNGGGDNGGQGEQKFDLNKFIDDKGFGSQFKIQQEDADKLTAGDLSVLPKILSEGLSSLGKEVYRHALMDSRQIINDKVEEAVGTAVKRSNGERQSEQVISMMNTDMPFTKDPNIAPVANAALSAAIKAGDKPEDAVKKVRKFFKHITGVTVENDEEIGGTFVNANGGSRGGNQGNQDVDWFAALSAGPGGGNRR